MDLALAVRASRSAGVPALRIPGVVLISGRAATILLDSFARFAIEGLGTPAPVFPAKHLVVTGWYRYVLKSYVRGGCVHHSPVRRCYSATSGCLLEYGALVWLIAHPVRAGIRGTSTNAVNLRRGNTEFFRANVPVGFRDVDSVARHSLSQQSLAPFASRC